MARATEAVIFFLASWRLSKMVTEEEGPGMIFTMMRELSGAEFDGIPEQWDTMSWHGKLMQCPYCLSVWISLFLFLIRVVNKRLFDIIVMSLSGSAVTVLIEDYKNG